jgi:choline dehydrogenase-like flavoprotein
MPRGDDDPKATAALVAVLSAVAEAIWPPLPDDAARARAVGREAEARFLETSARAYGGEVLTLVRAQLAPEARDQLLLLLRLLRVRATSPALLGPRLTFFRGCFGGQDDAAATTKPSRLSLRPRLFEELTIAERECVLLRWQRSPLPLLRLAFKGLKSLVAGTLLTSATGGAGAPGAAAAAATAGAATTNGNGHAANGAADASTKPANKSNPFWAGMGYSPESFVGCVPPADAEEEEEEQQEEEGEEEADKKGGGKKKSNNKKGDKKQHQQQQQTSNARASPGVYAATLAAEEVLASAVLDAPTAAREARRRQDDGATATRHPSWRLAERLARARFSVVGPGTTSDSSSGDAATPPATTSSPLLPLPTATIQADAVVVGSGAGGAVAAAVLARAGLRVVVVEKGPWRRARDVSPYEGESMRYLYESAGFVTTRDGSVGVLAGSALGGGTKINWCASLRTPQHVRDEWASPPHGLGEAVSGARFDAALDAVCERLLGAGWRLDDEVAGGGGGGVPPVAVRPGASCWGCDGDEDGGGGGGGGGNNHASGSAAPPPGRRRPNRLAAAKDPLDRGCSGLTELKHHHHACTTVWAGSNGRLWDGLAALEGGATGGAPRELPRNCASRRCSAACALGCSSGNKASADVTWLADAAARGCLVLARCHARRVLVVDNEGGNNKGGNNNKGEKGSEAGAATRRKRAAAGVELDVYGFEEEADDGPWSPADAPQPLLARIVVRAPIVFSAAGALHTPALLLRSGVTAGGAVGKHLRLHPASGVVSRFLSSSSPSALDGASCPAPLAFSSGGGAVDMYRGVMMATYSTAKARWPRRSGVGDGGNGNANKNDDDAYDDGYGAMVSVPVCHPGMLGATCQWESGRAFKRTLMAAPDIALSLVFARDGGAGGRVTLGKGGRPALDYWPRERDQQSMLDGLELCVRAAVAAGACEVFLPHNALGRLRLSAPGVKVAQAAAARGGNSAGLSLDAAKRADAEALEAYVARMRQLGVPKYDLAVLSAHQMGSARMGCRRGASAFDTRGESWDVKGLYVADASAFPTPSGVNPMVTVQALAHVVASGVVEERRRRAGRR